MTDLQRWKAFAERAGVPYREEDGHLVVDSQSGPKMTGWSGFWVELHFSEEGELKEFGIWE